jgi:hypothetical protein
MERGPQRKFGRKGLFRTQSKQSELGELRLCQCSGTMEAVFQPCESASVETFADHVWESRKRHVGSSEMPGLKSEC